MSSESVDRYESTDLEVDRCRKEQAWSKHLKAVKSSQGEEAVLGLVLASGICGLLLGHYFRIYATLPVACVLLAPAYFVGQADGPMTGILAFVFSLIAMQGCFLLGATIRVFRDNFAPTRAPSEEFL